MRDGWMSQRIGYEPAASECVNVLVSPPAASHRKDPSTAETVCGTVSWLATVHVSPARVESIPAKVKFWMVIRFAVAVVVVPATVVVVTAALVVAVVAVS